MLTRNARYPLFSRSPSSFLHITFTRLFVGRDFRAKTREGPRLRGASEKFYTDTMRQAARVSQRGRFPTPGSPRAIRLRNRKYKLFRGWSEKTCVVLEEKPQIISCGRIRPAFSHRHSRATRSKMAITSSFDKLLLQAVKVKDRMSPWSSGLPLLTGARNDEARVDLNVHSSIPRWWIAVDSQLPNAFKSRDL